MSTIHPFERMKQAASASAGDLDDLYPPPASIPADRKTGLRVIHRPGVDLRNYIEGRIPLPAAVHRAPPTGLGALLNTRIGDCGEAMAIHGVEMFHRDAGTPAPPFGDGDAENFYGLVAGYDPSQTRPDGSNPTDNGTDNNVLVEKWKNPGISCQHDGSTHTILESVFVDPKDSYLTRLAIWEFVVCFRAYALPLTAQQQRCWDAQGDGTGDSSPGSWGYHDVPLTSYGPYRVGLISWGLPWTASWAFERFYSVQGFVVLSEEQRTLRGVSPAGVDWTKLNADFDRLKSGG